MGNEDGEPGMDKDVRCGLWAFVGTDQNDIIKNNTSAGTRRRDCGRI